MLSRSEEHTSGLPIYILITGISALIVIGVLLPMAVSTGKGAHGLQRQRWSRFAIYAVEIGRAHVWSSDLYSDNRHIRSYCHRGAFADGRQYRKRGARITTSTLVTIRNLCCRDRKSTRLVFRSIF